MDPTYEYLWAVAYDLPPEGLPQIAGRLLAKGECPHCGKIIGKGLYRHKLACERRLT